MLNVFITVDTEVSSLQAAYHPGELAGAMSREIFGATERGEFGLRYQIEVLNAHRLKAVFLVDALFADVAGHQPLQDIVDVILDGGQEVQLHLHTEWLSQMRQSVLPGRTGSDMKDFTESEQVRLIARGVENLTNCGVSNVSAFRAGNYGANFDTLSALARNGLRYDT